MNVLRVLCISLFLVVSVSLSAQQVKISAEKGILDMEAMYINKYRAETKRQGWRIQFYSTTDRRNMESTIRRLQNKYPEVIFKWIYNNPYYQVRAGAFLYKKDLVLLQNELKKEFPGAYPIPDEIDLVELKESY